MTRFGTSILQRCVGGVLSVLVTGASAVTVAAAVVTSAPGRPPAASAVEALAPVPSGPAASAPSAAAPAKRTARTLAFKVVVTGDGRPVSNAEVTLKPVAGSEVTRFTGAAGEANFSAQRGKARVRVLATGWASKLSDVTVADGNLRAEIALEH